MSPTPPPPSPSDLPALGADVLDALPHGLAVLDGAGVVVSANRRWAMTGGDEISVPVGSHLPTALRSVDGGLAPVAEHIADGLGRLLSARGHSFQVQFQVASEDDPSEVRWFLLAAERLAGAGLVVTRTETTVHHSVNDVLADLAFHDALTGLPNRSLLLDRMRMALIRAQRLHLLPLVVFVDLDGFKEVNDRYGHAVGDLVLVEASRRLTAAVREGDTCGRWGGDEFVLIVELGAPSAAPRVLDRLRAAFDAPVVLPDGTALTIVPSLGAVVADGSAQVEALLHRADEAMYEAKRSRSPRVVALDPPLLRRSRPGG